MRLPRRIIGAACALTPVAGSTVTILGGTGGSSIDIPMQRG